MATSCRSCLLTTKGIYHEQSNPDHPSHLVAAFSGLFAYEIGQANRDQHHPLFYIFCTRGVARSLSHFQINEHLPLYDPGPSATTPLAFEAGNRVSQSRLIRSMSQSRPPLSNGLASEDGE